MSNLIERVGARILLLDPAGRLLLIQERLDDPTLSHWLTPGGGVEAGEELRDAAVREVAEETGIVVHLPADAPIVYRQRRQWSWSGVTYDQQDHFFVAWTAAADVITPQGLTAMERQTVLGHRWWTLADLETTDDTLTPHNLAEVLDHVLRERG